MGAGSWEHFDHDADIGLRATAASREEIFELTGEALTALITDPATVRAVDTISVSCNAPDDAMLLVDWINALVYEMASRRMLFSRWHVELDAHTLKAKVRGETVDRNRHQPVVEVKGATYTALSFARDPDGNWVAQCVVDV
jgi:tRNA nucleotidyltransferase (CCA-adding enzyme)